MKLSGEELKSLLDEQVDKYNRPDFIPEDPVCIPHEYALKQDIEIAGFFAAILAWGQRKTIINKCHDLFDRMDREPYAFIRGHEESDLKRLLGFKHRTFNDTDLLYFVAFLRHHYLQFESLEDAFLIGWRKQEFRSDYVGGSPRDAAGDPVSFRAQAADTCLLPQLHAEGAEPSFDIQTALINFRKYFFSLPDYPVRTHKHISSPAQKSTCKRLNMYLRWMVRQDQRGVDFGLWRRLSPAQLICPFDVHVDRVARQLGLVQRKQRDWQTAEEVTDRLREFDPKDPVKYDFALFGMGVMGVL